MTINDQIRDEKLQYDINRNVAKISALSSGKIDKHEYLTGEEISQSNQKQIIEKAKFTYSPLENAFDKETKTIEDQGKKQVEALKGLYLKTKETEGKSDNKNHQSIAAYIFNDYIKQSKSIMNEFYESVGKNKLYFEYVGPTKDVNFYEQYDSKELFNEIKNNRLRFDEALKKQLDGKSK